MVRVIKGADVRTVEGEAHLNITLDLNININADGSLSVGASAVKKQNVVDEHDVEFERPVPTFEKTNFKFGKQG